jgi:hypothetical protein
MIFDSAGSKIKSVVNDLSTIVGSLVKQGSLSESVSSDIKAAHGSTIIDITSPTEDQILTVKLQKE